jgi:hypothetical protein
VASRVSMAFIVALLVHACLFVPGVTAGKGVPRATLV